eukprot:4714721-Prymnesium_polylepis.1
MDIDCSMQGTRLWLSMRSICSVREQGACCDPAVAQASDRKLGKGASRPWIRVRDERTFREGREEGVVLDEQ